MRLDEQHKPHPRNDDCQERNMSKKDRRNRLVGSILGSGGTALDSPQPKDKNGVSSTGACVKGPDMALKRQKITMVTSVATT